MPIHGARFRAQAGWLGALLTLCGGLAHSQPQTATLRGIVLDSAGLPVPNAEIRLASLSRVSRSDTVGAFVIRGLPASQHELTVRRMGYQLQILAVALMGDGGDPIRITLVAEPLALASVEIEAREHPFFREFEQRRANGVGTFITEKQIDALHSSYPSDAFRSLPGIRVLRVGGASVVRFPSPTGLRRGTGAGECAPGIWIDGQSAPGMEVDDIRAGDIHGIEVYRGASTTPSQFVRSGNVQCGTIVVWTRRKK